MVAKTFKKAGAVKKCHFQSFGSFNTFLKSDLVESVG